MEDGASQSRWLQTGHSSANDAGRAAVVPPPTDRIGLPPRRISNTTAAMKLTSLLAPGSVAVAALLGCGPPPKQASGPEIADSGGQDMAVEEEKTIEGPAKKMPDEMTAEEKLGACCAQCERGLAADQTKQAPDQIPCVDYAASGEVRDYCVDFFRAKPMNAADCKGKGKAAPGDDGRKPHDPFAQPTPSAAPAEPAAPPAKK